MWVGSRKWCSIKRHFLVRQFVRFPHSGGGNWDDSLYEEHPQNRMTLPRTFPDEVFGSEAEACPRFVYGNLCDAIKAACEYRLPPDIS